MIESQGSATTKQLTRSHGEDSPGLCDEGPERNCQRGEQGKDTNRGFFSKSASLCFCSPKPKQKICKFCTFVLPEFYTALAPKQS